MCQFQATKEGVDKMATRPTAVQPNLPSDVLPNADWADAYEIETRRDFANMKSAAFCMVGTMPRWAKPLLWLRNMLVAPFGLQRGDQSIVETDADHIDFFPVLSENDQEIVLGLDDRHLNFRILLERRTEANRTRYRLTTLVERHNLFGRTYLFLITPFHKLIVRSVLTNAL
jgi:hypothetical protein